MNYSSSLSDFEIALQRLDDRLENIDVECIDIYAIGGFAMMYYGIREGGYTVDIDSLTKDFDDKVLHEIELIAEELQLESDWLNTDCAKLDGFLNELAREINWVETKYEYKRIKIKIADIYGLIRSKVKAVHDGGLVPRSTDKKDLISLLKHIEVHDIDTLNSKEELEYIQKRYTRCYEYLKSVNNW